MGEYEHLREFHNECCKEWEKERAKLIENYNSLSRDLHSGKFCNTECCNLIKTLKELNERLIKELSRVRDIANTIVNGHHFTDDIEGHFKELAKQVGYDPILTMEEYVEQNNIEDFEEQLNEYIKYLDNSFKVYR